METKPFVNIDEYIAFQPEQYHYKLELLRQTIRDAAPEADEVSKMKMELRRVIFEEQSRGERRKSAGTAIESQATGTLKPWREVVTPHKDVASGRYQQAEFAADLWQVHIGEGSDEYRKPVEFVRRTNLTTASRNF